VIPRYSLPEMEDCFSDATRVRTWLEIELLAMEARAGIGELAPEHARDARSRAPEVDDELLAAIAAREAVTGHDVAAFVDVVQERIGLPAGAFVHHGLTSSDVVDTAWSVALVRAADLLLDASTRLVGVLKRRALEHARLPIAGRTHGMYAEPTTFGAKLALFCLQADRDRSRLRRARETVAVGKLSGAVGTYSNVDPAVEAQVCAALGLVPVPASQVLARDRHAEFLYACASAGATVEAIALELRHLQRSEVGEVEEPFGEGQKGSSAMPHKRNPVTAERLCGLARVLRGYLVAGLEDVALWHERDISHSSVERIVLPDAAGVAYYSLRTLAWLLEGLVVHPERMREHLLVDSLGLVFSQAVLLALVEEGMGRDEAYRLVQAAARRASAERRSLREVLDADERVAAALGGSRAEAVLDRAFDLDRALRNSGRVLDALDEVDA
jgi:adenylosuccinate lyase